MTINVIEVKCRRVTFGTSILVGNGCPVTCSLNAHRQQVLSVFLVHENMVATNIAVAIVFIFLYGFLLLYPELKMSLDSFNEALFENSKVVQI